MSTSPDPERLIPSEVARIDSFNFLFAVTHQGNFVYLQSRGVRRLLYAGAAASLLALATCAGLDEGPVALVTPSPSALLEFFRAPLDRAWTAQSSALVLIQRPVAPTTREQIVGLANETTLAGDNFLLLVAYGSPATVPRDYTLAGTLERAGGVPFPFVSISDSELRRRADSLGTYFWKEFDTRTGVACVLAIRRLDFDSRMLPANTAAMEVVLRNCVTGSAEEALAPLRPDQLSVGFASANINGSVRPRVLNPLAAPEL